MNDKTIHEMMAELTPEQRKAMAEIAWGAGMPNNTPDRKISMDALKLTALEPAIEFAKQALPECHVELIPDYVLVVGKYDGDTFAYTPVEFVDLMMAMAVLMPWMEAR